MKRSSSIWVTFLALGSCAATSGATERPAAWLFRGGTIVTVSGEVIRDGDVAVAQGKIVAVGRGIDTPKSARVVDLRGRFVTPGLIDTHSHIGVYSFPGVAVNSDGNEMTAPVTAEVRAADAINLDDPAIPRAWRGGVTTVQVLPGSGNCIGGQSAVVKLKRGTLAEMLVPGAPRGLKMAMGENPKRTYGGRGQMPMTRMGSAAVMREAFAKAAEYRKKWDDYNIRLAAHVLDRRLPVLNQKEQKATAAIAAPDRDLRLEVLADVLRGKVRPHVHGYRVDDILTLFRIADEFGFKVASLQHALSAWKLAPEIARRGVGVATFSDEWGYKHEMADSRLDAPAILHKAGVRVSLQTDHPVIEQRFLVHEVAKSVRAGLPEAEGFRAVTLNPAWMLGIDTRVGSLEAGKDADLVVWSGHPMRIASRVDFTMIDGEVVYERRISK
ncbi:MAG: amidohydrolase [Deltaproteobacteria bacterium]|nr:amidohydrolase [Deltaproteobacteria bacterium]